MPLSDRALQERIATQVWTHNIRLTKHVWTLPGAPDFLTTDFRLKAILRALQLFYGDKLTGLRVADLGCLEGAFALAIAKRGAEVIGFEARDQNLEKANLLKKHFGLENLAFVHQDVKRFDSQMFGMFDVVLALGILYHLDHPVEWLKQIAGATSRTLIVDTHFAPSDEALHLVDPHINRLGPIERITIDGLAYEGRWFREVEGRSVDPDTDLWAAYSNDSSFWLTKEALIMALHRSGFDVVLEQQDWIADRYRIYTQSQVRVIFLAAKIGRPEHGPAKRPVRHGFGSLRQIVGRLRR